MLSAQGELCPQRYTRKVQHGSHGLGVQLQVCEQGWDRDLRTRTEVPSGANIPSFGAGCVRTRLGSELVGLGSGGGHERDWRPPLGLGEKSQAAAAGGERRKSGGPVSKWTAGVVPCGPCGPCAPQCPQCVLVLTVSQASSAQCH